MMSSVLARIGDFSLRAYRGDAKTLLAFNFGSRKSAKNLAGFTIQCRPKGRTAYYIHNYLRFEAPGKHAQDSKESPNSSINAPIHKFRWIHVPGQVHQGTAPYLGKYTYTVTPRYFDDKHSLMALDPALSASATILVDGFSKDNLTLGFTRGYVQSQAFVNHFGLKALIRPKDKELQFDTSEVSGTNAAGDQYTYLDEYEWLGFTAREKIFMLLNEVLSNRNLVLDVFAYDLNEPDVIGILLKLAKQGRVRVILDNAALHHNTKKPKAEDEFADLFAKASGKKQLMVRGKFGRYAHDKVFIVSRKGRRKTTAIKVLTGSTNFSVTGLYVNSNHILIYTDREVAGWYADVFEEVWQTKVRKKAFVDSDWANKTFTSSSKKTPKTDLTFSPHSPEETASVLGTLVDRIAKEGRKSKAVGSVLFAVMAIDNGVSPVFKALKSLHSNQKIFSFGISDSPGGVAFYPMGKRTGVLVTGKPAKSKLPPPFNQVPNIGIGHQIHHKFVVCGFNGVDPVVFCGSSNLASGGEENNGDNLLAIHDRDIATVFAIEAIMLVDHFNFLDRVAEPTAKKPASKQEAAVMAGWFLSTSDRWAEKYFNSADLHSVDRKLFA